MNDDIRTSFLTYYVRSLGERTREEKKGICHFCHLICHRLKY